MTAREPETLAAWLAGRTPPVPEAFASWMEPADPERPVSVDVLAGEAGAALARALDGAARERKGAFDLLAADGFVSYACERALEGDDPRPVLLELVRRLSA